MDRGDVYKIRISLPDRAAGTGTTELLKYVVVLQAGRTFPSADDVAVVVASSLRPAGRPVRPYEVLVGRSDGFQHDTVIDCRWVFTILKTDAPASARTFRLSGAVMNQVSAALVVGLQL